MMQTEVLTVGAEHPRGPERRARIAVAVALTGALLAAAFLAVNRADQPRTATATAGSAASAPSAVTVPASGAGSSAEAPSITAVSGAGTTSLAGRPPGLLIK